MDDNRRRADTTPLTQMLSTSTRRMLDRHIEHAFRQRYGAGNNLRHAVRLAVLEMATQGASTEAIRSLLTHSVLGHPQRYRWDHVSMVTGLLTSAVLTSRMLQWAEQPRQTRRSRRAVRPAPSFGGGRRL